MTSALPAVRDCLESETEPLAKAATVQAFCSLEESEAVEQIFLYLYNDSREIQQGATIGLLRYGGISGILAAGHDHCSGVWRSDSALCE